MNADHFMREPAFRTEEERLFWIALNALSAKQGIAQSDLAKSVGVSQGYISKILGGKQAPKERLRHKLSDFFGMSYHEMLSLGDHELRAESFYAQGPSPTRSMVQEEATYAEAPRAGQYAGADYSLIKDVLKDIKARETHNLRYTEVPLREATGSMGGGSTETGSRTITYLSFRTEWIRAKGNAKFMSVIRAFGDSMYPTIQDGSVVLVDEGRKQFVHGKIFYLRMNGQMYIKRLVLESGDICVVSDNDKNMLRIEDADDFEIIGRCIWTGRELE
jgi:phage repressor protein C with HTH and peptisase S24 domain/DNA-binding XRE family transcriptional regulator